MYEKLIIDFTNKQWAQQNQSAKKGKASLIDPTFEGKNKEKKMEIDKMFEDINNSFKEIQREIDSHRMFIIPDMTKTEINLKKNEESRYEQQLG